MALADFTGSGSGSSSTPNLGVGKKNKKPSGGSSRLDEITRVNEQTLLVNPTPITYGNLETSAPGISSNFYSGALQADSPMARGTGAGVDPALEERRAQEREKATPFADLLTERPTMAEKLDRGRPRRQRERKTYEMTPEQYEALSDRQRAAIDFNTMLVRARQEDLSADYDSGEGQRQTYQEAVEKMFGADGGSEIYAPATMAVLEQLNWQPPETGRGADLDDFLDLKVAVREKDLKDFTGSQASAQVSAALGAATEALTGQSLAPAREQITQALVERTQELTEKLTEGYKVIKDFHGLAAMDRNRLLNLYGGSTPDVDPTGIVGRGNAVDGYFKQALDALGSTQFVGQEKELLAAVKADLGDENWQRFLRYAGDRSKLAIDFSGPLGDNPNVNYRDPKEFRKILGLDKGD